MNVELEESGTVFTGLGFCSEPGENQKPTHTVRTNEFHVFNTFCFLWDLSRTKLSQEMSKTTRHVWLSLVFVLQHFAKQRYSYKAGTLRCVNLHAHLPLFATDAICVAQTFCKQNSANINNSQNKLCSDKNWTTCCRSAWIWTTFHSFAGRHKGCAHPGKMGTCRLTEQKQILFQNCSVCFLFRVLCHTTNQVR